MSSRLKSGSLWRRWDPHIHAPGTVFNDQFGGEGSWDEYLTKIEELSPHVEALGITDYFGLEVYEEVCAWKKNGRLPNVNLIFPNVELRYAVGTQKGAPVNFHLLISPDDEDHVTQARRFLEGLTFKSGVDTYRCRKDELIRLGRAHSGASLDEKAAYREGANQFKVEVDAFIQAWNDNPWIQNNALIAVSANSRDGASGLQGDASLAALRTKIERISHVIFSAQPKQREFWLGDGVVSKEDIVSRYGGIKPCLHGSDAHDLDRVGRPDKQRYCWIKGDACFDTLRQVCLEPEARVALCESKPQGGFESQTITSISMRNAEWFGGEELPLNGGLVGVIGARGSGKTALADMIAAGAYALNSHANDRSFVRRAQADNLLAGASSILSWADGSLTENDIDLVDSEDIFDSPRVQYLSQQFVERLCSSDGATDELIEEIQRVIFMSHPAESRLGAESFSELLDLSAMRGRQSRHRSEESIRGIGRRIAEQREKKERQAGLKRKLDELRGALVKDKKEKEALVPKGAEARAKEFEQVSEAANSIRQQLELLRRRQQGVVILEDYVEEYRKRLADEELSLLRDGHRDVRFEDDQWAAFKMDFMGDVEGVIGNVRNEIASRIKLLEGDGEGLPGASGSDDAPQSSSFLPSGPSLESLPLSILRLEEDRLQKLIGIDADKRARHRTLSERIRKTELHVQRVEEQFAEANAAGDAIQGLIAQRTADYESVFEGIVAEELALKELYRPLSDRLGGADGALGKLTLSVKRIVDVEAWAKRGEELIDTRRTGEFRGRGALLKVAERELGAAWRTGDASSVSQAMSRFRDAYDDSIVEGAKADKKDRGRWLSWTAEVSEWLYGTNHISLAYSMRFEGVDIETLSPGTRGIVLLMLYLGIDTEDGRPLIIDQPEENLDPKSIFEELVSLFRAAKHRRQIIIVTHNANLIVNTDADQVIIAKCGELRAGHLPEMMYTSGSLEDQNIRGQVCDILEGGEQAFRQRARRLRVTLN